MLSAMLVTAQTNLKVQLKIKNSNFTTAYLEDAAAQQFLDTAKIDKNGNCLFKANLEKISLLRIYFSEENFIYLISEPKENVQVEADASDLMSPVVKGSPNTEMFYNTYKAMKDYKVKIEDYTKKIEEEQKKYLHDIILKNLGLLSNIYFTEKFNVDDDFDLLSKLDNELFKKYPDNQDVIQFHDKITSAAKLSKGLLAPDLAIADTLGKELKLSSLHGKYVLIDFWASWCKPCRQETPKLKTIYEKYHAKGFEIYSVSLDEDSTGWRDAIAMDQPTWLQVSELKGGDSDAAKTYGVQTIPFEVLIDKEGKIIKKNVRSEELEKLLADLLK